MESIAAFDFDGTISKRDTLHPFALYTVGFWRWAFSLIRLLPSLFLYLVGWIDRQELKVRTLTLFFFGLPLAEEGERFAQEVLPKLLKKKALETIEWHKQQGHTLVLISASPETYLLPWGKRMGFAHVLASRLELDSQGRATGRLIGKNCRGKEKVRRLQEAVGGEKDYELWAYGDSDGDFELLAFADHKFYRKI